MNGSFNVFIPLVGVGDGFLHSRVGKLTIVDPEIADCRGDSNTFGTIEYYGNGVPPYGMMLARISWPTLGCTSPGADDWCTIRIEGSWIADADV